MVHTTGWPIGREVTLFKLAAETQKYTKQFSYGLSDQISSEVGTIDYIIHALYLAPYCIVCSYLYQYLLDDASGPHHVVWK